MRMSNKLCNRRRIIIGCLPDMSNLHHKRGLLALLTNQFNIDQSSRKWTDQNNKLMKITTTKHINYEHYNN